MIYIYMDDEDNIGFKFDGIHEILEEDIPVTKELYTEYLDLQEQGFKLTLVDKTASVLSDMFDIVKEETLDVDSVITTPDNERISAMENALLELLMMKASEV